MGRQPYRFLWFPYEVAFKEAPFILNNTAFHKTPEPWHSMTLCHTGE